MTKPGDPSEDRPTYYKGKTIPLKEYRLLKAEERANAPSLIPHQLHGCNYMLLQKDKKEPAGKWRDQKYTHNDPLLTAHIKNNHNYGVRITGGLCVMDADHVAALMEYPYFVDVLMDSFTVKSGKERDKATGEPRTGCHIYFYCPELPADKWALHTADGVDLGDIRGSDHVSYVVGPGSIHPDTGNKYKVINDADPITVNYDDLMAFIHSIVPEEEEEAQPAKAEKIPKVKSSGGSITDKLGLNVTDFLMPINPRHREHQIEGNHPVHKGNTGSNLALDPIANVWWCRHCTSGGGALEALAVADGILDCSYFKVGNAGLGDHWAAIFDALKKRGYSAQLAEMDRERKGLPKPVPKPVPKPASTGSPAAWREPRTTVQPPMPTIGVNGRDLKDVTEDTLRALHLHNTPPTMFVRAGKLVRIETDEKEIPKVADMSKDAVRGRCSCAAHFTRTMRDTSETLVYPPLDIVSDILALGSWLFPTLNGVIEAPAMRPDGTILSEIGFDEATGLYYSPTYEFRNTPFSVPDEPTQEDVDAAKKVIAEIICDFPFVDGSSRINFIAALITPIVRDLISGSVPMVLFDKPQPGTGASLLTEIIGIISTGRPAAMLTAPKTSEEWKKSITSTLIEGRLVVTVDNIEGKLHSPELASLLTLGMWTDRILGRSEMVTLVHRMIWIGNGNNIQLGGDLPRRCYWVRLDAQMARPQDRKTFRHKGLKKYVMSHRAEILSAVLILARSWIVAGRPEPDNLPTLGGYEEWIETVGGILAHVGYTGFIDNQVAMYDANDVDTPQWEGFLAAWYKIWPSKPVAVAIVVARLDHDSDLVDALPDTLADAYLDRQKSFVRVLGKALSGKKDRRFTSGLSIVVGNIEKRAVQWKVIDTKNVVRK